MENYQKYYGKLRKFPASLWGCTKSGSRAFYLVLTQGITKNILNLDLPTATCYAIFYLLRYLLYATCCGTTEKNREVNFRQFSENF